jgi:hypothetical protein
VSVPGATATVLAIAVYCTCLLAQQTDRENVSAADETGVESEIDIGRVKNLKSYCEDVSRNWLN